MRLYTELNGTQYINCPINKETLDRAQSPCGMKQVFNWSQLNSKKLFQSDFLFLSLQAI